ncbi:MAG: CAP domain-containing protein [Cytophagales bacterium]|nr:CAP domain-containing protein [Cytophagales bacterium]
MKLVLIIIFPFWLCAQSIDLSIWNQPIYEKLNTAKAIDFMSDKEKEVVKLMNYVRAEPKKFKDTYLKLYLEQLKTRFSESYQKRVLLSHELATLYVVLDSIAPKKPFHVSKGLTLAARGHAKWSGEHGATGHTGEHGSSMQDRITKHVHWKMMIAENCEYGSTEPMDIVCNLLIDEGVPRVAHRKNILHRELNYVGVAVESHHSYKVNCVMDFAGKVDFEKN